MLARFPTTRSPRTQRTTRNEESWLALALIAAAVKAIRRAGIKVD